VGLLFNQLFKFPGPSQAKPSKSKHTHSHFSQRVCLLYTTRQKEKKKCLFNVFSFFLILSLALCVLLWWWKQNKERKERDKKNQQNITICRLFFCFLFLISFWAAADPFSLYYSFWLLWSIYLLDRYFTCHGRIVTLTKFRSVCDIAWPLTFLLYRRRVHEKKVHRSANVTSIT
jgi:hypothetical protein